MRAVAICLCLIMLAGCAAPEPEPLPRPLDRISAPAPGNPAYQITHEEAAFELAVSGIEEALSREDCTPEQAVEAYLELQYLSYISLMPVDLGRVLDLNFHNMHNLDIWQKHLVQRRRLLEELKLCYVERERFPYTVRYLKPEDVSDGRLDYWDGWDFKDNAEAIIHFVVEGEPGMAYPPLMVVGGDQTIRLRRENGRWKILFIYFPGASRKFYVREYLDVREDSEVRAELLKEFMYESGPSEALDETSGLPYRAEQAVSYAGRFALVPNDDFYHAGDWAGNCMNFVSQCVLHGFGDGRVPIPLAECFDYMTEEWFAGEGGGVFAWENVNFFWDFATDKNGPMAGRILGGARELASGDLVQTMPRYHNDDEDETGFTHCMIVVDGITLKLAQNSPSNFVYYADLVDTEVRAYRPIALGVR